AGPRSGELEKLKVGDVSDHDVGKIIRVDGKTGQRDVTITNAVPYLRQWLNSHPAPDDDDAPLWSKLKSTEPISYRMFRNIFKDAAERVGLDKPDDPTNFRKSSASALASKGVSQAHLEKRYGWKRGSDAAARYIRVFGQDADRELAEARGMDVNLTEPEPDGPKDCKRCGVLIDRDAEQCDNCGFIQDREKAFDETTPHGDIDRMVEEFVREEMPSNTELREMVRDTLGEVLLGSDLPTLSEEDLEALKAREEDRAPITDFPDLGTADEQ
ncbi:MAG: tyrosine-type recombinase/integrase, partial [Halobacteriaceae archaeon]